MRGALKYSELDPGRYNDFIGELIADRGGPAQQAFIEAVCDNKSFVGLLMNRAKPAGVVKLPPLLNNKMTGSEFEHLPVNIIEDMVELWSDIPPAHACRSAFWGLLTIEHIRKGKIDALHLPHKRNGKSARQRIDSTLAALRQGRADEVLEDLQGSKRKSPGKRQGKTAAEHCDQIVRDTLRHMSGLRLARGVFSIYEDCVFARGWWRGRVAREALEVDPSATGAVHRTLNRTQALWGAIMGTMVGRNSVLGDVSVRTALILALADFAGAPGKTGDMPAKAFTIALDNIGIRSATKELSVLGVDELRALFVNTVFSAGGGSRMPRCLLPLRARQPDHGTLSLVVDGKSVAFPATFITGDIDMRSKTCGLLEFIDDSYQLVVPVYQRSYEWKPKQRKTLLDDVMDIGEAPRRYKHYIGAVVYKDMVDDSGASHKKRRAVIDGQQRLATTVLLLKALHDTLEADEEPMSGFSRDEIKRDFSMQGERCR